MPPFWVKPLAISMAFNHSILPFILCLVLKIYTQFLQLAGNSTLSWTPFMVHWFQLIFHSIDQISTIIPSHGLWKRYRIFYLIPMSKSDSCRYATYISVMAGLPSLWDLLRTANCGSFTSFQWRYPHGVVNQLHYVEEQQLLDEEELLRHHPSHHRDSPYLVFHSH